MKIEPIKHKICFFLSKCAFDTNEVEALLNLEDNSKPAPICKKHVDFFTEHLNFMEGEERSGNQLLEALKNKDIEHVNQIEIIRTEMMTSFDNQIVRLKDEYEKRLKNLHDQLHKKEEKKVKSTKTKQI